MTKPKLPKRWIGLCWGTTTKGEFPKIGAWRNCEGARADLAYSSVSLHQHRDMFPCVVVNDPTNRIPLRRLVRAVELAAIHAGLVEDREEVR